MISLLGEYQKISENIEEMEREQDVITRTTEPHYWALIRLKRIYNF
jgi:hypothetical protein